MAVFLGTPAAAVPALSAFQDVVDVDLVVTRPDRPRGRSGRPVPPPVKVAAGEWGLPVAQPENAGQLLEALRSTDCDVALVVAYGRILSAEMLAASANGFLNVHFSLLPRWRGAAPVERAILEGDPTTGVSLMLIDEGLDTGPVVAAIETPISGDETGGSLTARLAYLGAKMVDDVVPEFLAGRLAPAPQLTGGVRIASQLSRAEARLDGSWDVARAERAIRAFHPRPGSWVETTEGTLAILRAAGHDTRVAPGEITSVAGMPVLGLSGGSLVLLEVQPAGKRAIDGRSWMNGRRGVGISVLPPA